LIDFSGRVFSARSLFTGTKFEFVNLLIEFHFFGVPRCFGGFVSEGYGMTETSCVIAGSQEGDNTSGHVGPPNPACGKEPCPQVLNPQIRTPSIWVCL
jgi:hypothetical protein